MCLRFLFFALVIVTGGCVSTHHLSKPFEALGSDDNALRRQARMELKADLAAATAPGADGKTARTLEAKVIARIDTALPLSERLYLIRLLELFGGEASLDALGGYLQSDEAQVRDSARRALSSIPDPRAGDLLFEGASKAAPDERPAFFDALVYRRDRRAIKIMTESLQAENPGLVEAAATGLAKLGVTESIPALRAARANAAARDLPAIEGALLEVGVDANLALELAKGGANASIRGGAFSALLAQDADRARGLLDKALGDDDFPGRTRMLQESMRYGEEGLRNQLVALLSEFPEDDQRVIIEAVGAGNFSQYESDLLALVPSAGEALKGVLFDVLGKIGGDASYEALYDAFLQAPNDRLVAGAIARLRSDQADARALAEASSEDAPMSAIKVLALRNSPGATALLNAIVAHPGDGKRREEAMKALETIGNLESAQVLAGLVIARDPVMRHAQSSLKRLSIRFNAPTVLWEEVYEPALASAANDEARAGLVVILDGVGCTGALNYLRPLVRDPATTLHTSALSALSRWPEGLAGDVWIDDVILRGASPDEVEMAKRSILRLLSHRDLRRDPEEMLKFALRAVQATADEEFRRAIIKTYDRSLHGRERVVIAEVFAPLLNDPALRDLVRSVCPQ